MEKIKIAIFSAQDYEKPYLDNLNTQFDLHYFETHLNQQTASLAKGYKAIACFVNDTLDAATLDQLANNDCKFIALRSAGYNYVDLKAAKTFNIRVARVPEYSPYAVAEFAVALILMLNRKLFRAYTHVREHDFSLQGLLGFDVHGKTAGVIGTGNIGTVFAKIMLGFGCNVIAYDPMPSEICKSLGLEYVELDALYQQSDIISLHCPLNSKTEHIINESAFTKMKQGVMLINTGRGALVDSKAAINALKTAQLGYLGMDVYEEEESLFFEDLSETIIQDDLFACLQTFPNVVIRAHQTFFTEEAVTNIARITLDNLADFLANNTIHNEISA